VCTARRRCGGINSERSVSPRVRRRAVENYRGERLELLGGRDRMRRRSLSPGTVPWQPRDTSGALNLEKASARRVRPQEELPCGERAGDAGGLVREEAGTGKRGRLGRACDLGRT
jgi:hypothetical protein